MRTKRYLHRNPERVEDPDAKQDGMTEDEIRALIQAGGARVPESAGNPVDVGGGYSYRWAVDSLSRLSRSLERETRRYPDDAQLAGVLVKTMEVLGKLCPATVQEVADHQTTSAKDALVKRLLARGVDEVLLMEACAEALKEDGV